MRCAVITSRRQLAGVLQGEIQLVSEPGRGATFFVDLPVTHQPAAAKPLIHASATWPSTRNVPTECGVRVLKTR